MFSDVNTIKKKIKIKQPYIYEIKQISNLVFNLQTYDNDKSPVPIMFRLEKLFCPWIIKKDTNFYDICICDNDIENKFNILNKIQHHIIQRIKTNDNYSKYIDNTTFYNYIQLDNTFKLPNNNAKHLQIYDSNNTSQKIDSIESNSVLNVILQLNCFWIRKNWHGFTYKVIQIQNCELIYNSSLFLCETRINSNLYIKKNTNSQEVTKEFTFKINKEEQHIDSAFLKPSLADILSARNKIFKK